ncbi:hypothetical protein CASFOL_024540 [Castilleja foliolosa]|uniref:Uncharacterized protein n=1 Tax=Castilleja foliolosa TaxID=1961234 RepID=A0ABD3CRR1_9LAMI
MDSKDPDSPINLKPIESSVSNDDDLNKKFALFLQKQELQHQYQTQLIPLPNIHGADPSYDAVKRDLLKETPQPTVEMAYAALRREAARITIVNRPAAQDDIGAGLVARNQKPYQKPANSRPSQKTGSIAANQNPIDKSTLKCDHCQKSGHTKKGCFELIGYPDWYENNPKFPKKPKRGTAATTGPPHAIIGGQQGGGNDEELGFAAYMSKSKRGGNNRGSDTRPKAAAVGGKRQRASEETSHGGAKRPPAAAIPSKGAKSGSEVQKGSGEIKKESGVQTLLNGLKTENELGHPIKLSVPLGPSDMMGIEPDGYDGLDFLNDEPAGPNETENVQDDQSIFDGLDELPPRGPIKSPTEIKT